MPKMKTHRGAAKRFKKTGSGKIRFKRAFLRHCLEQQPKSAKRVLRKAGYLSGGDARAIQRKLRGE
ncbi:MAG: 50S ribosomal protein L35 [Myxococcota bacterium]